MDSFNIFFFGIVSLVACMAVLALVVNYRRWSKIRGKDYEWYAATYPDHCKNGEVTCLKCGRRSVRVRGLGQHAYTREHLCGNCGQTLFYSPEGR